MKSSEYLFVDIDTQFDFMSPEGNLYVPGAEKIKPQLKALIEHAQEHNIPILASADAHAPDDPEFEAFPPHCIQNTAGQAKIDATAVQNSVTLPNREVELDLDGVNHVVLEKTIFDVFGNPNTEKVLEYLKPQSTVVFGVATDYCVKAAALGLRARGYDVIVVDDAIRAVTPEGEAHALEEMQAAGVRFQSSNEILGGTQ